MVLADFLVVGADPVSLVLIAWLKASSISLTVGRVKDNIL
jgi:hypothetical protein